MKRVRALAAHEVGSRPPVQVRPGDVVEVGERDTQWPAFVFVTSDRGSGWVPSRHVRDGMVVEAYDTTELPTGIGEVLDVVATDLESGWVWCRNASAREGWVPVSTLGELGVG